MPLPVSSPSLPVPAAALALLGACNGLLDVSMNTQAAAVERRAGRAIMSSFHALFSLGGIAGALLAAGAMWAGMGDVAHVAAAGLVALAAVTVALTRLVPARPGPAEARAARVRPSRSLASLGILATRVATSRRPSWGARWSASGRERHPGALQRGARVPGVEPGRGLSAVATTVTWDSSRDRRSSAVWPRRPDWRSAWGW
jgi:hypothetical protein